MNSNLFRPFNINTLKKEEMLNKFITVAPVHQSYAMCIEYIKHWFLEKFSDDFFSFIHMDGSHVFGEINKLSKQEIVNHYKDDKGVLTIIPQIDDDYDRERIDMNLFGIDQFINTTKIDKAFMRDPINKKYIMMKMDQILMNFTFRLKFPSRAKQLDIFKYMKLAFRVHLSESKESDMDYLMPYPLMLSIASDCGFEIVDDRIKEPIMFLTYLNSRSFIPIIYKRSNVNNKEEYFVRVSHLPIRIAMESISKDDGNKVGHLSDNFGIEFNINVRFPSMQLYIYYTKSENRFVPRDKELYSIDNALLMAIHYMDDPPAVNDKGWNLYVKCDWEEDNYNSIEIDIAQLFNGELSKMIDSHIKRFTSPNLFMDIHLYNDGIKLDNVNIDWSNMKIHYNGKVNKLISTLAIYVDLNYLNTQRIEQYQDKGNSRIVPTTDRSY